MDVNTKIIFLNFFRFFFYETAYNLTKFIAKTSFRVQCEELILLTEAVIIMIWVHNFALINKLYLVFWRVKQILSLIKILSWEVLFEELLR